METDNFKICIERNIFKSFDYQMGWMYYYPVNYPLRTYQFNSVKKALFTNILLCLPTGLGKTFVAAVVIMNYYRWFPEKKVIFIAHTRPLVNQQQTACMSIASIHPDHAIAITGTTLSKAREELYANHRVLFMTPQVLQNDIAHGYCRPQDVVCLVIDEAHKAAGDHAFCQSIQGVVDTLNINEIAYYHEDHEEVKAFVQNKEITEITLLFDGEIKSLFDDFGIPPDLVFLSHNGHFGSFQKQKRTILGGIVHHREFKDQHRTLVSQLHINQSDLYERIFKINQNIEECLKNGEKPQLILGNHFTNNANKNSRVIVFSQYRDSVDEIIAALSNHKAMIKAMAFVGQSDTKSSKGLKQKEQIDCLAKFRSGDFNVLVSTSVGEEGLDIGEVNLIVFFDISSSPLRLIQRMGRTGRKKSGKIILLMMKGAEQSSYNKAKSKSKSMYSLLSNKLPTIKFAESYRIIPPNINPFCLKYKFRLPKCFMSVGLKRKHSVHQILIRIPRINFSKYHETNQSYCIKQIPAKFDHSYPQNITIFEDGCIESDFESVYPVPDLIFSPKLNEYQSIPSISSFKASTSKIVGHDDNIIKSIESLESIHDLNISSQYSDVPIKRKKRIIVTPDSNEGILKDSGIFRILSVGNKSRSFHKQPYKKKFLGRQMLLTQAEVIDKASSDTDVSDENDLVPDSFINDESVNTSELVSGGIYRQSLLFPTQKHGITNHRYDQWAIVVNQIEEKHRKGEYESEIQF
ncbi:hypothetical protein MXB_1961 [Myxobolus squamalis]|nr:hypothetical protein MXB_1961 [Myxobolus squamalis]